MKKHGKQSKQIPPVPAETPLSPSRPEEEDFARQLAALFQAELGEAEKLGGEEAAIPDAPDPAPSAQTSEPRPDEPIDMRTLNQAVNDLLQENEPTAQPAQETAFPEFAAEEASEPEPVPFELPLAVQAEAGSEPALQASAAEAAVPPAQEPKQSRRALRAQRKAARRAEKAARNAEKAALPDAASEAFEAEPQAVAAPAQPDAPVQELPAEPDALPARTVPAFAPDKPAADPETALESDLPRRDALAQPSPAMKLRLSDETGPAPKPAAEPQAELAAEEEWSDAELYAAVDALLSRQIFGGTTVGRRPERPAADRSGSAEQNRTSEPAPGQNRPEAAAIKSEPARFGGETRRFSIGDADAAQQTQDEITETLPDLSEVFPTQAVPEEAKPVEEFSDAAAGPAVPEAQPEPTVPEAAQEAMPEPAQEAAKAPAQEAEPAGTPETALPADPVWRRRRPPREKKRGWLYRLLHPTDEDLFPEYCEASEPQTDEPGPEDLEVQAQDLLPDQLPLDGFHARTASGSGSWGLPNQLPLDESFRAELPRQSRNTDELPAWLQEYRDSGEAPADAEIPDWIKSLSASDQDTLPLRPFYPDGDAAEEEAQTEEPPVRQEAPAAEDSDGPDGPDLIPQVRMQSNPYGPRTGFLHLEDLLAAAVPMETVRQADSAPQGGASKRRMRRDTDSVSIPPVIPEEISTVEENPAGLTPEKERRRRRAARSSDPEPPRSGRRSYDSEKPESVEPPRPAPRRERVKEADGADLQAPERPAPRKARGPETQQAAQKAETDAQETAQAAKKIRRAEREAPRPGQTDSEQPGKAAPAAGPADADGTPAAADTPAEQTPAAQAAVTTVVSASVRRHSRENQAAEAAPEAPAPRKTPAPRQRQEAQAPNPEAGEKTAPARRRTRRNEPDTAVLHPEEAYRRYVRNLSALGTKLVMTALFAGLSLFFSLYLSLNWRFLPDFFSGGTTVYVLLALLLCMVVTNGRLYADAAGSLFRKHASPDLLLIPATVFTALDTFRAAELPRPQFTVVIGFLLLISLWGKYDRFMALTLTVRQLREKEPAEGVAEVQDMTKGSRGLTRTEPDVDRFMQKLETRDLCERVMGVYTPIALLSGLVITLLIAFGLKEDLFWTGSLIFIGCTPLAPLMAFPRMYRLLSLRLADAGGALCGYHAAEVFGGDHSILISDDDIFPEGSLRLNGFKVYNGNPDRIIAYAAAASRRSVSALSPLFEDLLRTHVCRRYTVDSFRYYDSGGIGATIIGDVVLMGSLDFMRHMGVHMDRGTKVRQAVYLSINGELAAVFAVKYVQPENLRKGLAAIAGSRHFKGILVTRTFLGTPGFLKAKFGIPTGAFAYPSTKERLRLSETELRDSGEQGAILTEGSFSGFAQAAAGGRLLRSGSVAAVVLSLICGIVGLLLMTVLAVLPATETATAINLLLYAGAWMIPTLLLIAWARHF